MKSKKNKSRSSRGGGWWDNVKGLFESKPANQEQNQKQNQAPNQEQTQAPNQEQNQEQKDSQKGFFSNLNLPWPFNKLSKAPPVPTGSVQIPGKPPQPQPEPQQQPKLQSLQSSSPLSGSSMQAAPAAGGRRRRRTYKNKHRK
jgi:hypothetical protein